MARLEEIREKLYRKGDGEPQETGEATGLPPTREPVVPRSWDAATPSPQRLLLRTRFITMRRKKISRATILTGAGLLLIAALAVAGYFYFFVSADVAFSVLGPNQAAAGDPATITLEIVNRSSVALADGEINLTFPEGVIPADRQDIPFGAVREKIAVAAVPAGGEFRKELRIKLLGVNGETKTVTALFNYRPENIQTKLTRRAEFSVAISRVPVVVTTDAPDKVSSGQDLSFTIGIDSELSNTLAGMSLGVDFPPGFVFKSADPAPDAGTNNRWSLGDLSAGTSKKISLHGSLTGDPEEVKAFDIRVGRYEPTTKSWLTLAESRNGPSIASPLLLVQTTINGNRSGSLAPGDQLSGVVSFKNNLPTKVDNVTIALSFPETLVELKTIRAERGFYDVIQHAVVWNSASESRLKELNPGEGGQIAFSLSLKSALPIRSFSDKNFVFPVETVVDTASPPPEYRNVSLAYHDHTSFKIASSIGISAGALYFDPITANSGPLPPKARQTTTYTVAFKLTSGANDLTDVEVDAALPGGVAWKGAVSSDVGTITYNPATQQISWRIPSMSAATGILRSPITGVIQVALTPAENQVGSSPVLVSGISVSGHDAFADATEHATTEDVTTQLREDSRTNSSQWSVVP